MTQEHDAGHDNPVLHDGIDLMAILRALRRRADLSQRELAAQAGIAKSTVAAIEAGEAPDPRWSTVELLVRAAGGQVAILMADGTAVPVVESTEELRDRGGRRYPAHLDVWALRDEFDWWGARYENPSRRLRRELTTPEHTFFRSRRYRDVRRRNASGTPADPGWPGVRRLGSGDEATLDALPRAAAMRYLSDPSIRHWVAEYISGYPVGCLSAVLLRSPDDAPDVLVVQRLVLAAQLTGQYRITTGRRLVVALLREAASMGIQDIRAPVDDSDAEMLYRDIGFSRAPIQPIWLANPVPPGTG
jgi:transcriptional regulator with XRE-family HTH domain